MNKHHILRAFVLGVFVFITYQPLLAGDPANDARAVFVAFVKAAKDKNSEEFTSYIAKEDLKEMEKEGFVDLMMAIMADETPDLYKGEATGNQVIFKKEMKETSAEGTVTGSSTVYMVKEDGKWKFGKPRN